MKVRVTFTESLLGTASADPEIHREFIASKSPNAETIEQEVEAVGVDGVVAKSMTVFPREDGKPFVYDYQIKGFFKDACGMLSRVPDSNSKKLKAYKKVIDGLIFVGPRKILLELPDGGKIESCQRPLRAQTAQGERIALANSESAPAGTTLEFEITALDKSLDSVIKEWLEYGKLRGFGQWRNSGRGRFTFEYLS